MKVKLLGLNYLGLSSQKGARIITPDIILPLYLFLLHHPYSFLRSSWEEAASSKAIGVLSIHR
jgi:hypothetical protein